MKTTRRGITVRQLFDGYQDHDWDGIVGFGGKLDIRPKYQREFIYDDERQRKVIDTVIHERPLNIMYWVINGDHFDLLDGQQRTLSVCRYLDHKFAIINQNGEKMYFDTLPEDEQEQILNYPLEVCICDGTENEIYDWFRTININGLALNEQEMLNATYTGEWLTDARRHFSKPNCAAYGLGKDYMKGSVERQDYLAKVLKWISKGDVKEYMAEHRRDANAGELWQYFESIIAWVRSVFPVYRSEMKGLDWGKFYDDFKGQNFDASSLEEQVKTLMVDDEVQSKTGVYEYVLYGQEKSLSLRTFDNATKRTIYERQNGHCPYCDQEQDGEHMGERYEITEMEADHIVPWSKGGKTTLENCQMLCKRHNNLKSNHLM